MKYNFYKTVILFSSLFIVQTYTFGQNKKLQYHAVSIGPGIASSSSGTAENDIGIVFDMSTKINNHLISFNFNSGLKMNSARPNEEFYELNLTYGRKYMPLQKVYIEGHIGLGIFAYKIGPNTNFIINTPETTLGFPIRAKLIYYPLNNFGIGLNPNYNINSIYNSYSLNFIVQYNFK